MTSAIHTSQPLAIPPNASFQCGLFTEWNSIRTSGKIPESRMSLDMNYSFRQRLDKGEATANLKEFFD
mgnify:CR=1 FL=1